MHEKIPGMVKHIHHLKLVHHPVLVLARAMHHLSCKVTPSEAVGHHDRVNGGCTRLDTPVQPPVLGLGFFNNVMARLVSFNGHHLLHKEGHTLGSPANFLAGVIEFVKALGPKLKIWCF